MEGSEVDGMGALGLGVGGVCIGRVAHAVELYRDLILILASLMEIFSRTDNLRICFISRNAGHVIASASRSERPQLTHLIRQRMDYSWSVSHLLHFGPGGQRFLVWPRCQQVWHL